MRFVFRAMCAVALAGCSDVRTPVESKIPTLSPENPTGQSPESNEPRNAVDPRSLPDRLEALYGNRFTKVSLPPDRFSLSADAVHPDMACPPGNWNGAQCWLMYTPYKNSDPSNENPAFLLATTDSTWATPPQVSNPLVPYPGLSGYNSDPDHAFDATTRRMVQVYRVVADSFNKIMMMSTADAREWTKPVMMFQEKNHDAVSPALVLEADRTAKLWYVRAGADGCAASQSSVVLRTALPDADSRYEHSTWTAGTTVSLTIPGYVVWHLDVIELPTGRGYVAFVAAYQRFSNCSSSDVWLATSADGLTWRTYAMPVFWRTMKTVKSIGLSTWYRGTLRYNAVSDTLDLWPSALVKGSWGVYHATAKLSDLLGLLQSAQATDFHPPALNQLANLTPIQMP